MIKIVTLRPIAPFTCKAFVLGGLAIVTEGNGEFILYHQKSGLMLDGWPIIGAKHTLQIIRALVAVGIDWETLDKNEIPKLSLLTRKKVSEILDEARTYSYFSPLNEEGK